MSIGRRGKGARELAHRVSSFKCVTVCILCMVSRLGFVNAGLGLEVYVAIPTVDVW